MSATVHPFTRGRFQGVTLYRRLFDILSNPTFRSYRSLLTPTLDLTLVLLKLSISHTKRGSSAPAQVEKRLRFAIPSLMELAYLLVFGTTTLTKERAKKVLRPRTPSTHMFKSLILVVSRLSSLPSLVPVLVRLGGCEWGVEVLKEMRDHVPSVSAVVFLLLNIARDQQDGAPPLSAIIRGREDEHILRYVAPLVDARHQLLFRHTRDLLWQLALHTRSSSPPAPPPFHYGWNLLDENYFGMSGNDYQVKWEYLDRQKHARMESMRELMQAAEDGGEVLSERESSDEDDSDGLESDADEDDDDGAVTEERRSIERSEVDPSASESFDSEGDSDEEGVEGGGAETKSPGKVRAAHGWMEVKLSEQAVKAGQDLRKEDVEEEEKEDAVDADGAKDDASSPDERQPDAANHSTIDTHPRLPHPPTVSSGGDGDASFNIDDFLPERWSRSSEAMQAALAKHQKEVEAAKTNSVRFFLNKDGDIDAPHSPPSSSPSASPMPSPTSSPTSSFTSLTSLSATDLLHSSMFSRSPHALPPSPTAVYPEPLHTAPLSTFLHDLHSSYHPPPPTPTFTQRVVYDRNVLGALQSITGTFISEPLTLFNSHPSLSTPPPPSPPSLSFESRFESANLCRATQLSPTHYRLELSHDLNTNAHTQWFLFRVRHMQVGVRYRFDVVNLEKKTSAFSKGMKPAMYSEREAAMSGVGWCRALLADKVYYFANHDVMQPRMSKAEITARTPRLSLVHSVLTSRAHSRVGSVGEEGGGRGTGAGEVRPGWVDVQELLNKDGVGKVVVGDEGLTRDGRMQVGVKGEGGAILTSFLSSETPLTSFSTVADNSSSSVPESPASGAPSPWGSARPSIVRRPSAPGAAAGAASVQYHSTLSFTLSFVHAHDTVYLAHFYPYTYTFLRNQLGSLQSQCPHLLRQPLCYTRIGNLCELLTITDLSPSSLSTSPISTRPIIVLSCRVHPGETNSSWALDGLLSFLCSSSPQAVHLRQLVVFKLVPMLNIDGVVEGNYRSNLSGLDLNRYWGRTSVREHPTIHHTKALLWSLKAKGARVLLYVDWHGHSTMASTGLYGCVEAESSIQARPPTPEETKAEAQDTWLGVVPPALVHLKERLFPMLVSQRGAGMFDYGECTYNVSQYKAGSARVVVWQGLRLATTYTLETTFYGADSGKTEGIHWNTQHYRSIGKVDRHHHAHACTTLHSPPRLAHLSVHPTGALRVCAELRLGVLRPRQPGSLCVPCSLRAGQSNVQAAGEGEARRMSAAT